VKILVTGGTGTLGRLVVPRLQDAGQSVRALSRQSHAGAQGIESVTGDLATGEGIESAVSGAEIIVHLAGTRNGDERRLATWWRPQRGPGRRIWCTSRSLGPRECV
jgi:nucleoside-diphosphate-sugar epimerase